MRVVLAGLFACLVAGPAHAAGKPWEFAVPPPASVQPLPTAAKPRSVSLVRVFVDMREGEEWGVFDLYATRQRSKLTWEGGRSDTDTEEFAHEFGEVLAATGFGPAPRRELFNTDAKSDLQIGAVINRLAGRFCAGCGWTIPNDQVKGAASMAVEWQIYSPIERKVLATIRTSGAYEVAVEKRGAAHILNGAFRENVRQLLNAPEFRDLVLGGAAATAATSQPQLAPIHFQRVATTARSIPDVTKSVVSVFANNGMGSGFLISSDGYVLTNQHVVGDTRFVKLRWPDGSEVLGEVIRVDRRRDIALIKASATKQSPLALRPAAPQVGEAVYAVGTPLDAKFQGSVTKGIVSATRIYDGLPFIQSDAVINSGNSGGPLIDERGAVIGICVSGMDINGAPAGINLFIPIDDALKALALTPAS